MNGEGFRGCMPLTIRGFCGVGSGISPLGALSLPRLLICARDKGIFRPFEMRRLFSIAAITTLLSQLASPLPTASCPHMKQMAACHRSHQSAQPAHHCEMMMHQDEGNSVASPREAPAASATSSPSNCPMDCCAARNVTNVAVIAGACSHTSLVKAGQSPGLLPVIFTIASFSSHTNRGPPTA
jgi:hypothetical protein